MKELFAEYNVALSEKQEKTFRKYTELLLFYNSRFNLTAITDEREIFVKHFLDSVLGMNCLKSGKVIDIGSGGGFPAIPLAVMREDIFITMLEATGKKCSFLETVITELDLKNADVINGRAEELAKLPQYREKFCSCTARAVARMNTLCEYTLPFVEPGGNFIAYKGADESEIEESSHAISVLGGSLREIRRYDLEGASRMIAIVDKVKRTPALYPRGRGKERKQPL